MNTGRISREMSGQPDLVSPSIPNIRFIPSDNSISFRYFLRLKWWMWVTGQPYDDHSILGMRAGCTLLGCAIIPFSFLTGIAGIVKSKAVSMNYFVRPSVCIFYEDHSILGMLTGFTLLGLCPNSFFIGITVISDSVALSVCLRWHWPLYSGCFY